MNEDPFDTLLRLINATTEPEEMKVAAKAGLAIAAQVVGSLNSIALSLAKIAESAAMAEKLVYLDVNGRACIHASTRAG